ncbi:MAG: hypothetical protein U0228_04195 [Myxococcaceae bacterium]
MAKAKSKPAAKGKANPFKPVWASFDLGEYRECAGTYEVYSYKSIPPIDEGELDGTFSWLGAKGRAKNAKQAAHVEKLAAQAKKAGLELPADFVYLLSRPSLCATIPSCTACEWDLSEKLMPSKALPGSFTVRFLRDQQDVFFWYLFLAPGLAPCVVVSPIPYDDPRVETDVDRKTLLANSGVVAPSFEHFAYRWWLENELWDVVTSSKPKKLTPRQQKYLDHYK